MTGMAWHRSGHDGAVHPFGCDAATVIMSARSFNRPLSDGEGVLPTTELFCFFK